MSPTYAKPSGFIRAFRKLSPADQTRFLEAVQQFVEDLKEGRQPRPGLRVKRVQGTADIWELTWAPDGRATFQYGQALRPGDPHIVWRRIGAHEVLDRP
ncbi:MAG: hypothetical protein LBR33_10575 [Propionibacteriaceae bacterium]|jgi:hypothetical protein|nr:hypothetical protein [Propionibacteriaceae bacterium]